MAPPTAGVEGQPIGQTPELWRDRVDAVPRVDAQASEPHLTPLRNPRATAVRQQEATSPNAIGVSNRNACEMSWSSPGTDESRTEQTKCNVVQTRAKDTGRCFDVPVGA